MTQPVQSKPVLSSASKEILAKIEKIIKGRNNATGILTYPKEGAVLKNFREYDLATPENREAFKQQCFSMVGFLVWFSTRNRIEQTKGTIPLGFAVELRDLEPWLSLVSLIDGLAYQMTAGDFQDELAKK